MSGLPFYLAAFVVVLAVLIVVHELGHYLAARYCGVKVLRFAIGFGRTLWQKKLGKDGTEWAIAMVPLGGYVKMLDEREGAVPVEELNRAFNRQSVGKRSLIVVAGPLANFLLAIVLYWVVFVLGTHELLPVLGTPPDGSPAAMAGIRNGEQVRTVDGEAVRTWEDFRWLLLRKAVNQESARLELVNERDELVFRQIYLSSAGDKGWEGDALSRLGIAFYRPNIPPILGAITDGGAAAQAGLLAGDRVISADGLAVTTWHDFVTKIRASVGHAVNLIIERDAKRIAIQVVPESASDSTGVFGRIGVAVAEPPEPLRVLRAFVRYGPVEAGGKAIVETWEKSAFSLTMMGKMLTGEVSWKNLSGPVTIADYAGRSARLGIDYYLKFMALVSISLGILNLLPIPVLDGGHLMYHIIEVVRRRPLSERAMEFGQQIGLSILFVLMAFAFFNDLNRLFFG